MKIKVIKRFGDKQHDLVIRNIGETLTVDDERAKELILKGFAEQVTDKASKTTEAVKKV